MNYFNLICINFEEFLAASCVSPLMKVTLLCSFKVRTVQLFPAVPKKNHRIFLLHCAESSVEFDELLHLLLLFEQQQHPIVLRTTILNEWLHVWDGHNCIVFLTKRSVLALVKPDIFERQPGLGVNDALCKSENEVRRNQKACRELNFSLFCLRKEGSDQTARQFSGEVRTYWFWIFLIGFLKKIISFYLS